MEAAVQVQTPLDDGNQGLTAPNGIARDLESSARTRRSNYRPIPPLDAAERRRLRRQPRPPPNAAATPQNSDRRRTPGREPSLEHDDGGDRCGGGRSFGVLNEEDGLPRLVCSSPIDPASGGADGAGGPITNVPPSPSISHSPLSLGDPTRLDCGYATLRWDLGTNHHFFLPSEVMEPGGAGGLLERAAVKSISVFAEFESEP
uniref:Uncharacterized protein n=1 Tax=Knipowitschia caucasica TaxID=637954 RepID=A0AAV2M9D1_KNICA